MKTLELMHQTKFSTFIATEDADEEEEHILDLDEPSFRRALVTTDDQKPKTVHCT